MTATNWVDEPFDEDLYGVDRIDEILRLIDGVLATNEISVIDLRVG